MGEIAEESAIFCIFFIMFGKDGKKQKVGEYVMRKIRKRTFAELVMENKRQLLNDVSALEKLEEKMETRWLHKPE